MPRSKVRPPAPRRRANGDLSRADTSGTSSSAPQDASPIPLRERGERVDAPSPELLGTTKQDWSKVGVWVTVGVFLLGIFGTAVWNYADTVAAVRGLSDDVKDLKRKADDLLRSSVDASARISALERRPSDHAIPPPAAQGVTVPRKGAEGSKGPP